MPPQITISTTAYCKLYFHAAKHAHQSVNGVLLGKQSHPGGNIEIEDAIPLLHHWTSLSPMMEIGLDLAGQYAKEAGLKLVAYYQGRATVGDTGLGPVGEKILERLREGFADVVGFTIDGEDFGTAKAALEPWVYANESGQWWKASANGGDAFAEGSRFRLSSPDLPQKALRYVTQQRLHQAFGDFDDHLEDVTIDWIHNRACLPTDV